MHELLDKEIRQAQCTLASKHGLPITLTYKEQVATTNKEQVEQCRKKLDHVVAFNKKQKRTITILRGLALLPILIILSLLLLSSIQSAFAYNCSLSTGSLSRGMQPFPDSFQCPHTNGNRVKVSVCDNNCNCYWVTQCQM